MEINRTSSYVEAVAARAAEQAAAAALVLQNLKDDESERKGGHRDRLDSVVTTTSEVDGAAADDFADDDTPVQKLEMNPDPAANVPGFSEHLDELDKDHKKEKEKEKEKEEKEKEHLKEPSAINSPADPGTPIPQTSGQADSQYVEHTQTLEEFAQVHKETNLNLSHPQESKGLDEEEAGRRLAINGPNQLTPPKRKPWIVMLLLQFTDPFLIMLIMAGTLALITFAIDSNFNNLYVGVALILVVLITGFASFLQEAKTARVMQLFTNLLPPSCIVIRGGNEYHTSAVNLVVGDLVRVNGGDKMPADMRVLLSQNGKMEASALTGESVPIVCSNQAVAPSVSAAHSRCIVFSGSFCVEGSILGVVIRTGDNTFIGNIANLASAKQKKTLMQKELERFVKFISVLALIMASIAFAVGTGRHPGNVFNVFVYGFLVVIVANIPQGLPATVTSLLTITASRMASRNILVKRLDSIETLGSASLICTDKTGTLTQNVMTVVEVWTDMENHFDDFARMLDPMQSGSVTPNPQLLLKYQKPGLGLGEDDDDEPHRFKGAAVYSETFEILHRIASVCNKAQVEVVVEDVQPAGKDKHDRDFDHDQAHEDEDEVKYRGEDDDHHPNNTNSSRHGGATSPNNGGGGGGNHHRLSELDLNRVKEHVTGNASDIALYHFCNDLRPVALMRNNFPVIFEIPFNSTNKWQLCICRDEHSRTLPTLSTAPQHYLMMKGAPEIVLTKCTNALIAGKEVPINDEFNFQFQKVYRKFASRGCRVLGFAHRYFDAEPDAVYSDELMNFPTTDLTFVGMVAIMDPPRPDVKAAIRKCHSAGIKVFMVTGDHQLTAEAIARDVGILGKRTRTTKHNVILGSDINKLSENDWRRIVNQDGAVFARTTPQQKLKIVKSCQALKQVVAVTGDGVNDAPALKHADIGVAMGISGNDVAREAANVVLLDDNFASVVVGIEQGRLIFDNLKKTIAYTLAHLMPEVIPVLLSLFLELPQGLSAMQILSIDLATELGPAISLAYEPIERDIMKRRPRNVKKDRLVSRQLLIYSYCIIGLIETFGSFFSFFWVFASHGVSFAEIFFSGTDNWGSPNSEETTCVGSRCYTPDEQDDIAFEAASAYYITLVVCQLCHLWSCKTRRVSIFQHTLDNHVTYWGSALTFCLIIIFVYVPGVDKIMSSHAANAAPWIIGLIFGGIITLFNEYRKHLVRTRPTWRLTKELRW